jgi:hypothetical protein
MAGTVLAGWAAAQEGSFRPGTYARKLGDQTWSIRISDKGKYTVFREDEEVVEGSYTVKKDEIELKGEKGKLASKEPGTYRWKLQDGELTFTLVKDESQGRAKALTSGPWKLQKK